MLRLVGGVNKAGATWSCCGTRTGADVSKMTKQGE
jgi:hypothetical protein